MSKKFDASVSLFVSLLSASEGFSFPEGWLWATIIAGAFANKANW